jgi:hypothetical protein
MVRVLVFVRRPHYEIAAVTLTGAGKIFFVNLLEQKFWFIVLAGGGWLLYLVTTSRQRPDYLHSWGFQKQGFWPSMRLLGIPALVVTLASCIYGLIAGHAIVSWHIIPVLVLYPLWGTIQQWLVISLFGANMLKTGAFAQSITYLLTALLFAVIHYPSSLLMAGTFMLALTYLVTFARHQNVYALGLYHGWLGGVFYYFALGRDPWMEFIDKL